MYNGLFNLWRKYEVIMTNIFPGGKVIHTSIGIVTSFLRDATFTMHEDTMTIVTRKSVRIDGYLSRKVSFWLFKIFEIQKGRTFNFNGILRLCTIVVNIAIQSRV